jgi:hypothetical protein
METDVPAQERVAQEAGPVVSEVGCRKPSRFRGLPGAVRSSRNAAKPLSVRGLDGSGSGRRKFAGQCHPAPTPARGANDSPRPRNLLKTNALSIDGAIVESKSPHAEFPFPHLTLHGSHPRIPGSISHGIWHQPFEPRLFFSRANGRGPLRFTKFPIFFRDRREFEAETGSI